MLQLFNQCKAGPTSYLSMSVEQMSDRQNDLAPSEPMHHFKLSRKLFIAVKRHSFFQLICNRSSVFCLSMSVEQMSNRQKDLAPTEQMHHFKLTIKTFHCN
jgi:hypothetical protein